MDFATFLYQALDTAANNATDWHEFLDLTLGAMEAREAIAND